MMIENVIYKFDSNQIFTKEDFRRAVHEENSDYKESSINWLLGKLKSLKLVRMHTAGLRENVLNISIPILKNYA